MLQVSYIVIHQIKCGKEVKKIKISIKKEVKLSKFHLSIPAY